MKKLSVFFVFIGRAYQFIFWDAPFRSFLWDQKLLEPLIKGVFNMEWNNYVTSLTIDNYIQTAIKINGFYFLLCAILSLIIKKSSPKLIKYLLGFGGVLLVILALLITKSKFYVFAMFFEHSIQFGTPFLLLAYLKNNNILKLKLVLKILIALTFLCHGLYALGSIFPLPANFVTMTINILGTSEDTSKTLLIIAAVLDFVIAIGVFIPRIAKQVLLYAIFWGFITAFARVINGLHYSVSWLSLHQYLYETIFRLAHGIIPLLLYLIIKRNIFSDTKTNLNNY